MNWSIGADEATSTAQDVPLRRPARPPRARWRQWNRRNPPSRRHRGNLYRFLVRGRWWLPPRELGPRVGRAQSRAAPPVNTRPDSRGPARPRPVEGDSPAAGESAGLPCVAGYWRKQWSAAVVRWPPAWFHSDSCGRCRGSGPPLAGCKERKAFPRLGRRFPQGPPFSLAINCAASSAGLAIVAEQ